MRSSLGLLVKPPTKRAAAEALAEVKRLRPQALLLNLPKSLDGLVSELARGEVNYEGFLEEVGERVPEPRGAWLREHEPILRELPSIGERTATYCYKDERAFRAVAERSVEIALLTIRDAIKGAVSLRDWLRVLRKDVLGEAEARERETERVAEISLGHERSICVSGFEAREIRRRLDLEGVESWIRYLGQPYHFPPLDILRRMMMRGEVEEERAEALIREHIRFIREYIYYKPFLEAVEGWVKEKLYWLPTRGEERGESEDTNAA